METAKLKLLIDATTH